LEAVTRVAIKVDPRPYNAIIERGLLVRAGRFLRELFPARKHCFIVSVRPVRKPWAQTLVKSLEKAGWTPNILEMPDGERHKRLSSIEELAEALLDAGAERNAVILCLGGGVVCDVGGFLASVYMRGVDVVHIPTTLLAQVDAAIGGKTGVNLRAAKNLVGTFYQPRSVLIDPDVLSTLPHREFRAGLYEALKCGVIGNPELFGRFERCSDAILRRDPTQLEWLIAESVKLKADIVAADEREGGLRQVLNFGHTIGHALEAETRYKHFLHGEAVGWGMIAATQIAAATGKASTSTANRVRQGVLSLGTLPRVNVKSRNIVRLLQSDKKTRNGRVHFVLPSEIGRVEVVDDVPTSIVVEAIKDIKLLSRVRSS
jgi:3-dehydroquinate synthase